MLGKILKDLRNSRGLTIAYMAEKFEIAKRTYVSYEAEEREPNLTLLNKFAEFYGVSVDYLLGRCAESDTEEIHDSKDQKMIDLYSDLSDEDKEFLSKIAETLSKHKKRNDGSHS